MTRQIQTVGIVGAGVMGSAIAENCLRENKQVILLDAQPEIATAAIERILARVSTVDERSLQAAGSYEAFANVDLVIETVVENTQVKKTVLPQIEHAVATNTLIASNTSAIPIEQLAAFVERPANFCGIHFCHPELMSLVEVIRGPTTSDATMTAAIEFVHSLNKLPVEVSDGAGFVVNRLLAAMIDGAVWLLMSGEPIETIDQAMREFGFQGGPFEIMDVIGIDTCLYAGRTMYDAGLDCVSVAPVLPKLVKRKRLGRKTLAGFYRYADARSDAISDPDLLPLIEPYLARDFPDPTSARSSDALHQEHLQNLRDQILAGVAREAFLILEQGVAQSAADVDLCIVEGFSFPQHEGGILQWADRVGIDRVVALLEQIAVSEPKLAPPAGLIHMATKGRTFF